MEKSPRKAAWLLFFLAPVVAELVIGATPISHFFNPITLVAQAGGYGCTALLLRELKIKWNAGYFSLFILGGVMAVMIEGLCACTFYNSSVSTMSGFADYGMNWHILWPWMLNMFVYHSLQSTLVPILLTEYFYPTIAKESWLSKKGVLACIVFSLFATFVGHEFVAKIWILVYKVPLYFTSGDVLFSILMICAFAWLAYLCKDVRMKPLSISTSKLSWVAFGVWFGYFFFNFVLNVRVAPVFTVLFMLLWMPLMAKPIIAAADANDRNRLFAWIVGMEGFWALFTIILGFQKSLELPITTLFVIGILFLIRPARLFPETTVILQNNPA